MQQHGENILPLCEIIKTVLEYNNPPNDDNLQSIIKKIGKKGILTEICKIKPEEKLYSLLFA
ncbi:hypothetical protein GMMP13_1800001 [Candidatus Magnetomoraceae bacterium gMMP-13]